MLEPELLLRKLLLMLEQLLKPKLLPMPELGLLLLRLPQMLELLLKLKLLQKPELELLPPKLLPMPELLKKQDRQDQESHNWTLLSRPAYKLVRTLLGSAGILLHKMFFSYKC